MSTWGCTKEADGSIRMTAEYARWVSTFLDESCDCGPHLDHADCIAEIEALIKLLSGK